MQKHHLTREDYLEKTNGLKIQLQICEMELKMYINKNGGVPFNDISCDYTIPTSFLV